MLTKFQDSDLTALRPVLHSSSHVAILGTPIEAPLGTVAGLVGYFPRQWFVPVQTCACGTALVSPITDRLDGPWFLDDLQCRLAGVNTQAITSTTHLGRVTTARRVALVVIVGKVCAHS